ncbi:phosphoenolpyruvate carboxylase [Anditalea andensis]|uniref:Phosphoenolpyruvate carboxylase n=1 Tax=Anditalea andensis TaxID=1048983 RepID=A0A074L2V2_9BACT|nr:phosphoenolpyruvate carboxylase [Anditalea andensis]KEO74178.1 phosphoenolpyruvate carboxylase [Anditalea andensis]
MSNNYDIEVGKRYTIYNSLFLDLPFDDIYRTGTLLPILQAACESGYQQQKTPTQILKQFFSDMLPKVSVKEHHELLFQMVQYIERQVVLFDSIEDAAFEKINETKSKGSINALINRAENDNKKAALIEKLKTFAVRITLTAHPTQFYPGNVLGIMTDLEKGIRTNDLASINLILQQLGKTAFIKKQKPTPIDEASSLIWYLENVFYYSIPDILYRILKRLDLDIHAWENTSLLQIGFWPGGDRDGNPFVTHETTMAVADKLQRWILKCYYRDIRKLRRRLTFKRVEPIIMKAENGIYQTLFTNEQVFTNKESLLEILYEARELIIKHHDGLFLELLDQFILKVKIFGFHFATMDIRQDSRKHDNLWEGIFESQKGAAFVENFKQLDEDQKLEAVFATTELPESYSDEFHTEMIQSFKSINYIQENNGVAGCHRYIISNCQSVLHFMEVFQLANLTLKNKDVLKLDIVPLFETVDDLANAPGIMRRIYNNPTYMDHLKARDKKQSIMLGFSDGTKDGGYIKANWGIFRAKEELTKLSREFGISVIFFDGRGGPPARGGGNMHNFYASLGPDVENEEIQVTIQGQTISANYGKEMTCTYNMEQLLSAGLENHLYPTVEKTLNAEQRALIDEMASLSYEAYKSFKKHPQFVSYLEHVTPLKYFGEANIGSRPVKRNKDEAMSFEDLRAIPFVGAWAQMKQNIPGFYGIGSAAMKMDQAGKLDQIKNLYKNSLFFRTLLGNSMQSLAKSNYAPTRYLSEDETYGSLWDNMFEEYQKSINFLLKIGGMDELLEDNPVSKSSIKIREKIVLPLITIQQYAIQQLMGQHSEEEVLTLQRLILRSMFGIINAARNAA